MSKLYKYILIFLILVIIAPITWIKFYEPKKLNLYKNNPESKYNTQSSKEIDRDNFQYDKNSKDRKKYDKIKNESFLDKNSQNEKNNYSEEIKKDKKTQKLENQEGAFFKNYAVEEENSREFVEKKILNKISIYIKLIERINNLREVIHKDDFEKASSIIKSIREEKIVKESKKILDKLNELEIATSELNNIKIKKIFPNSGILAWLSKTINIQKGDYTKKMKLIKQSEDIINDINNNFLKEETLHRFIEIYE